MFLEEAQIAGWLQPLPRLIWELSDSSPDTTALAIRMLLDAARFTPSRRAAPPAQPSSATTVAHTTASTPPRAPDQTHGTAGLTAVRTAATTSPLRSALDGLQRQLAPLFCVVLPQQQQQRKLQPANQVAGPAPPPLQGSLQSSPAPVCPLCDRQRVEAQAQASGVQARSRQQQQQQGAAAGVELLCTSPHVTPGPLSRLPVEVQLLAVDLMYHLSEWLHPSGPACRHLEPSPL